MHHLQRLMVVFLLNINSRSYPCGHSNSKPSTIIRNKCSPILVNSNLSSNNNNKSTSIFFCC